MSNPSVGRRLVYASHSQAPDALLRQLIAESPPALKARPGCLHLADGDDFLEDVPCIDGSTDEDDSGDKKTENGKVVFG